MGRGVAALASAALLRRRGWSASLECEPALAAPTLVLTDASCALLRHVFGDAPDPLRGAHRLAGRRVAWDADAAPVTVAQPSAVLDQALLLARLQAFVGRSGVRPATTAAAGGCAAASWIVDAGGRASVVGAQLANARRRRLGSRVVVAQDVALRRRTPRDTSAIESVAGGWLFLAPRGGDRGLLQAMVPAPPDDPAAALAHMLAESRLVGPAIVAAASETTVFSAAPQVCAPLCGPGWIAVGDAAIALDPICGDGTGHGLRASLLATAVLDAIADGRPLADCLRHYETRVRKAFLDHLGECLEHYGRGWTSVLWAAETAPMRAELGSDGSRRIAREPLRYGLRGERLVAL